MLPRSVSASSTLMLIVFECLPTLALKVIDTAREGELLSCVYLQSC